MLCSKKTSPKITTKDLFSKYLFAEKIACGNPPGDFCKTFEILIPRFFPSPKSLENDSKSMGLVIITKSLKPAAIKSISG